MFKIGDTVPVTKNVNKSVTKNITKSVTKNIIKSVTINGVDTVITFVKKAGYEEVLSPPPPSPSPLLVLNSWLWCPLLMVLEIIKPLSPIYMLFPMLMELAVWLFCREGP